MSGSSATGSGAGEGERKGGQTAVKDDRDGRESTSSEGKVTVLRRSPAQVWVD